jgi:biopolymer transport protein ExbB
VARTAPWFGVLGSCIGIVHSFQRVNGDRTAIWISTMGSLSEALYPTVLGVAVAILAYGFHQYLANRLAIIDIEMNAASLNLANALVHLPYHS